MKGIEEIYGQGKSPGQKATKHYREPQKCNLGGEREQGHDKNKTARRYHFVHIKETA